MLMWGVTNCLTHLCGRELLKVSHTHVGGVNNGLIHSWGELLMVSYTHVGGVTNGLACSCDELLIVSHTYVGGSY